MATTIKLKNGSGAPAASDLVQGEPAIDLTNKRLYTENASGVVIEVGSNPSSLSINGTAVTATAAEINTLDGITSSTAELNILDGVTSTAAELNILDGVTASTAEINILDGVTSTTAELNILDGVTSTTAELNILDGVTATATELNILDGVTSTTAELNILDGVTSTAAELNILDGVTSTTAELNILDGVTATATELNVLDGVTAFVDEDNMSSNSATSIPSQQSVKAYVDSQVTAQDLDFQADSGGALSIDLDSETLTFTGGTGIDTSGSGNAVTFAVDSTVATLAGSQTLTNKTLTSPDINTPDIDGGTIDGTVIGGSSAAAGTFSALVANSLTYPTSDGSNGQAIVTNGSGTLSFATISGGGGGITYVTKTANYTMSAGEGVIANTSGGTFTITLPATPSTGDQVIIADGSNWATTNLTVGRNGSTIEGVASDLTCDVEGISVTMVYDGSTWQLYPQTGTSPSLGIDDNATSTAVTIASDGDVGIGTTSPQEQLHVYTTGASRIEVESTTNVAGLKATNNQGSYAWYVDSSADKFHLYDFTDSANRLTLDGAGNVGIGTTSPSEDLSIVGSVSTKAFSVNTPQGRGFEVLLGDAAGSTGPTLQTNTGAGFNIRSAASGFITLGVNAEHMRIDSSGRLLVGKTAADNTTVGCRLNASGDASFVADGNRALVVVRNSSDGQLAIFLKDSTYVGQINARSAQLSIGNLGTGIEFNDGNDAVIPFSPSANNTRDNALDLGMSSVRWDDVYATNGTIQTSDINEKQDIEELTEAEQRVAVAAKALLRKFRWKSAVKTKSHDARTHFGIIAQDLQAAFEAEGLDAGDYGLFIHSEWWETYTDVPAVQAIEAQDAVYDEEGNLVSEAVEAVEAVEAHTRTDTYNTEAEAPEDAVRKERMGVRYSELLAFIIAAI